MCGWIDVWMTSSARSKSQRICNKRLFVAFTRAVNSLKARENPQQEQICNKKHKNVEYGANLKDFHGRTDSTTSRVLRKNATLTVTSLLTQVKKFLSIQVVISSGCFLKSRPLHVIILQKKIHHR